MKEDRLAKALFYPFDSGILEMPGTGCRALFLRGGFDLWPRPAPFSCIFQTFSKRESDRLVQAGDRVCVEVCAKESGMDSCFDVIIFAAPRQADELRAEVAQALDRLVDNGLFLCGAPRNAGGMRLEKTLSEAGLLDVQTDSRHHCRIAWGRKPDAAKTGRQEKARLESWKQFGRVAQNDSGYFSCPGLFGWDRVDQGSALLIESLPGGLSGTVGDFGCGYGFLSVQTLNKSPDINALLAFDDDLRAVSCCEMNMRMVQHKAQRESVWKDLSRPWDEGPVFDGIVMNPPFHEGDRTNTDLGRAFVRNAAKALKPGGALWMVANTHLPYHEDLASNFRQVSRLAQKNGFQVFKALA